MKWLPTMTRSRMNTLKGFLGWVVSSVETSAVAFGLIRWKVLQEEHHSMTSRRIPDQYYRSEISSITARPPGCPASSWWRHRTC
jgi:hypothetical protein